MNKGKAVCPKAKGKWHHIKVIEWSVPFGNIWSSWPALFCRSKAKRSSIIKKDGTIMCKFFSYIRIWAEESLDWNYVPLACFGIWKLSMFEEREKTTLVQQKGRGLNTKCHFSTLEMNKREAPYEVITFRVFLTKDTYFQPFNHFFLLWFGFITKLGSKWACGSSKKKRTNLLILFSLNHLSCNSRLTCIEGRLMYLW